MSFVVVSEDGLRASARVRAALQVLSPLLKRASCLQVRGLVPTRPAELSKDKTHSEQAYPAITDIRADIALRRFGSHSIIRRYRLDVRIAPENGRRADIDGRLKSAARCGAARPAIGYSIN